ncbi:AI-2E family transporter [Limosilactobacillus portuensis]|uniref:AI-2E family transporter n=1 Tax=Limosilactobacillus portuensis TaxID=2742601 RepID=UPI0023587008|nr:AI-2E family transporter [Limosilactobacillus portuensis]WCT60859.1 AI-2E family transporter [Limosilactobacillus portuensis]
MKVKIQKNHLSLIIALFCLYLAVRYWPTVAKLIGSVTRAAMPLLIGGIIAYIVNLLLNQYEHLYSRTFKTKRAQKYRRLFGIVLSYLTIILILVIVSSLVIPELISCIKLLVANHGQVVNRFVRFIEHNKDLNTLWNSFDLEKIKWNQVGKYLTTGFGGTFKAIISTASSVFSTVATAVVALFFSIYLLIYNETLSRQIKRLINAYLPRLGKHIFYVTKVFNDSYSSYIVGQCKDAAILGIFCFIGMSVLRMPYASMIGVVTAIGALIPIIGAILGAGIGVIIIFAVSPIQAGMFLIFIIILQQLDNRITYPLVVGKSIGLPSVWVFAAVIIGGGIYGILGMMFTVPLFAALYKIIKTDTHKRLATE